MYAFSTLRSPSSMATLGLFFWSGAGSSAFAASLPPLALLPLLLETSLFHPICWAGYGQWRAFRAKGEGERGGLSVVRVMG